MEAEDLLTISNRLSLDDVPHNSVDEPNPKWLFSVDKMDGILIVVTLAKAGLSVWWVHNSKVDLFQD